MAALPARCHSNIPTAPAGMKYTRKSCRSWSAFVIPMHESTKARHRSQPCSLPPRDTSAINRTRSAKSVPSSVRNSVRNLARFSYLLSGAVGGGVDDTLGGALGGALGDALGDTGGDTGGVDVFSTGISRQSIAYTNSPFAVLPIGRHSTGLATLLAGGAPARFGVCANAGEANSTHARATFFISISRDTATTPQFCHAAHG